MAREYNCRVCGKAFPPETPATRKYCKECAALVLRENAARRREQQRIAKLYTENYSGKTAKAGTLKEADKRYCRKCIYRGNFTENYLCDYISITRERRGCPAGAGCEKRVLESMVKEESAQRTCQRCGRQYEGKRRSHFCPDCRTAMRQEAARHMVEVRKERQDGAGQTE